MTNELKDIETFERVLSSLHIEISEGAEGVLTVCNSSEPLFCYDVHSREEAAKLVTDTLVSYARHFLNIEGLRVSTKTSDIDAIIPVERAVPVARLKPVLDLAA